jgi:hypothetical protein
MAGGSAELREAVLESQVEAALQGHDIGPFEAVTTATGGYAAECRFCGGTTWVGASGIRYSLLEENCPIQ